MPHLKCPVCGCDQLTRVVDPTAWYAEHWPDVAVGDPVPEMCPDCRPALSVGSIVELRSTNPSNARLRGKVLQVISHPVDGALYRVRFLSGEERVCIRSQLRRATSS